MILQTRYHPLRWVAFSVFVISSTINYLDRFLLNQLAPLILDDLHFTKTTFGWVLSATAILYAVASLAAGWMLDRWGVNRTMTLAVGWWSLAGMATAFVRNLPGLFVARGALAIGESAGIPAVSKVNGQYLRPDERALGTAVNGIGLSVGLAATPLWTGMAVHHSWRLPFLITGLLSLLWIPLWLWVSRAIPATSPDVEPVHHGERTMLLDSSLLVLVLANMLWMGAYSLWSNWTTLYLVGVYHLSLEQAAHYTWIPLLVSNLGGLFGGWLSLQWIRREHDPVAARKKAVWVSAIAALVTLALPGAHDPAGATAIISASFFFALAGSVNIYALAIDLFGGAHAGVAVAAMTFAYGVLQAAISPFIGSLADRGLYNQAVWIVTGSLLLSALVLTRVRTRS